MLELILKIYFTISGLIMMYTGLAALLGEPLKGIDTIYDWFWYAVLWIKPFIKSLFKVLLS